MNKFVRLLLFASLAFGCTTMPQLTTPEPLDDTPAVSLIAFSAKTKYSSDIYIANEDGTDSTCVCQELTDERFPVWSPDGFHLAYVAGMTSGTQRCRLMVSEIPGYLPRELVTCVDCTAPSWTPDGNYLTFADCRTSERHGIYLVSPEGGTPIQLIDPEGTVVALSWSPTGQNLAYVTDNGELYITQANAQDPKHCGFAVVYPPTGLAWSPDGHFLAYVSNTQSNEIMILDVLHPDSVGPLTQNFSVKQIGAGAWSPDGQWLTYLSGGELFAAQIAGKLVLQLTRDQQPKGTPSWIDNGKLILYSTPTGRYCASIANGEITLLEDTPANLWLDLSVSPTRKMEK